jgi:hypothetical protein
MAEGRIQKLYISGLQPVFTRYVENNNFQQILTHEVGAFSEIYLI